MATNLPKPDKEPMSASLFNMWRCVITIAHADGTVQPQERAYLEKIFDSLENRFTLTAEQMKALEDDLATPHKIAEFLPLVTSPEDRATLINFGDILAWADNEISVDEEEILKTLRADQMKGIDVEKLRSEIHAKIEAGKQSRVTEMRQIHADEQKRNPIFRALDRVLLKMGVDILDE